MAEHHVNNPVKYIWVFAALLVLTIVTWAVAQIDLGPLNNIVAMGVASTKAGLVIWFFMHVQYTNRLTKFVVASGFMWLALMFILLMQDYVSRGWLDRYVVQGWFGPTLK
jgi:cytochrome c oxidase subunit 4